MKGRRGRTAGRGPGTAPETPGDAPGRRRGGAPARGVAVWLAVLLLGGAQAAADGGGYARGTLTALRAGGRLVRVEGPGQRITVVTDEHTRRLSCGPPGARLAPGTRVWVKLRATPAGGLRAEALFVLR